MYKTRNGFTKGAATDENISEDNGQYMVIVLFFFGLLTVIRLREKRIQESPHLPVKQEFQNKCLENYMKTTEKYDRLKAAKLREVHNINSFQFFPNRL